MNTASIIDKLTEYTPEEKIYKRFYELRNDEDKLYEYILQIRKNDSNSANYIWPKKFTKPNRYYDFSNFFLDSQPQNNVYILKHPRYTPEFEHNHDFFEIICVLSGECINHCNGSSKKLVKGDLCFISPKTNHSIWATDGIVLNLLIRKEAFNRNFSVLLNKSNVVSDFFINSLFLDDFFACLIMHCADDVEKWLLEMVNEQYEPDEYSEDIISSLAALFFVRIIRNKKYTYEMFCNSDNLKMTTRLLNYLTNNYSNASLMEFSEKMGYSMGYCSRLIKKTTGCTFSQLYMTVRINMAGDLLINANAGIGKISELLGYECTENFIRAFKRKYGMSPGEYRKKR